MADTATALPAEDAENAKTGGYRVKANDNGFEGAERPMPGPATGRPPTQESPTLSTERKQGQRPQVGPAHCLSPFKSNLPLDHIVEGSGSDSIPRHISGDNDQG